MESHDLPQFVLIHLMLILPGTHSWDCDVILGMHSTGFIALLLHY